MSATASPDGWRTTDTDVQVVSLGASINSTFRASGE
jgi:hypothetical protein